jgi:hypothetical protein
MALEYGTKTQDQRSWKAVDNYDESPAQHFLPNPPQSGLGLASFILALTASGLFLQILVMGIVEYRQPRSSLDEERDIFAGFLVSAAVLMAFGAGLGTGGLCQYGRRKVWAIVGLCLNSTLLMVTLLLLYIGLTAHAFFRY